MNVQHGSTATRAVPEQKKTLVSVAAEDEGVISLGGQMIEDQITASGDRSWEDNARNFAALDAGDAWEFAVLVACSVEKSAGGPRTVSVGTVSKVSAREFAEAAGTSPARVLRFLTGWENAASQGEVPRAAGLSPNDVPRVTLPNKPFLGKDGFYESKPSGVSSNATAQSASKIIERRGADAVVDAMPAEQRVEVAAAILRDPEVREKVAQAADVMPIIENGTARNVRRDVKEHEARAAAPEKSDDQYVWQALMNLRVAIEQRPHLWPEVFSKIDVIRAEYAVDGKVRAL